MKVSVPIAVPTFQIREPRGQAFGTAFASTGLPVPLSNGKWIEGQAFDFLVWDRECLSLYRCEWGARNVCPTIAPAR